MVLLYIVYCVCLPRLLAVVPSLAYCVSSEAQVFGVFSTNGSIIITLLAKITFSQTLANSRQSPFHLSPIVCVASHRCLAVIPLMSLLSSQISPISRSRDLSRILANSRQSHFHLSLIACLASHRCFAVTPLMSLLSSQISPRSRSRELSPITLSPFYALKIENNELFCNISKNMFSNDLEFPALSLFLLL